MRPQPTIICYTIYRTTKKYITNASSDIEIGTKIPVVMKMIFRFDIPATKTYLWKFAVYLPTSKKEQQRKHFYQVPFVSLTKFAILGKLLKISKKSAYHH